ncbi:MULTISPECIES: lipoyl(octanoyl) transferase LipB [Rhodococcus]|uniref:Octanoyltransferase n=1 Tax=Rhodococcus cerastii TaxID=908616 RepID=A0ABU4CYD1_9NOCA|nr:MULTISPECIES: lipoyl(octanoyl) transferase LipB [Rhodococcus]MCJ0893439.1 lipoyl(octanoyl) transferase LipB [Rhodococcus sp. ARC_M5]MCJ0978313.1 lipoyl(octanoyl) transferase LipB [Rhodococcus sp. ARC_M12]MDV6302474.1 lipoyl(octanoyl) transferase LipB [Rhodococcus cerastii]MDV7990539.1 lipoyl(octanoyl) transferase LipB [Rhodococcus sp. IEGM 1374]
MSDANSPSVAVSARASSEPVVVRELGTVEYTEAWALQRELAGARADGVGSDTLLLLEHPSVYTAGRRTSEEDMPRDGTPVVEVDRGGKITWHGPGQLVGYPIVELAHPIDVVRYVRRIEEALISVVSAYGIGCGRVDGRSGVWLAAQMRDGVWLPERKIAAIGVRVQRGVTLHGFSLNCNAAMTGFDAIVPCGIADAGVTSLSLELGRDVSIGDVTPAVTRAVLAALDGSMPVQDHEIEHPPVTEASINPQFTTVRFGA